MSFLSGRLGCQAFQKKFMPNNSNLGPLSKPYGNRTRIIALIVRLVLRILHPVGKPPLPLGPNPAPGLVQERWKLFTFCERLVTIDRKYGLEPAKPSKVLLRGQSEPEFKATLLTES